MQSKMIDLRSDTVTRPTEAMRRAMGQAEVGDDVYGEDPTVLALEARMAAMSGKEAALFMPTGTQSNLVALMVHCQRGDEYIVGQRAHTYRYEGGGAAVLGSIQPQPVENAEDGSLPLVSITAAIKPDDVHFARTKLVTLENTIGGRVLAEAYVDGVAALARANRLAFHLDGARVFNAAIAQGRQVGDLCAPFDSVSICLSKGLGAPAGSVLCGSSAFIEEARRWRKMLGGGMRQVGILAAAGLYALDHHVARLHQDHLLAIRLANGLRSIEEISVDGPHTNMVFVDLPAPSLVRLEEHCRLAGIVLTLHPRTRLVTHLDVNAHEVDCVIATFKDFFGPS